MTTKKKKKGKICKKRKLRRDQNPSKFRPKFNKNFSCSGREISISSDPPQDFLEFAANWGHGSFKRLDVKGFVKGIIIIFNFFFFPPAMVLFKESALWDVFGNGDLSKGDFPTEKKKKCWVVQQHKYLGFGAGEGKEIMKF